MGYHKCILKAILPDNFFPWKSAEQLQFRAESMLCYMDAAVENFWTSAETEITGKKKSIHATLTQLGEGLSKVKK